MKYRVMVADDEFRIRKGIISLLKKYDQLEVVQEAEDDRMALEISQEELLDLVFVDINMPFLNGFQFIEQMKKVQPDIAIVIITGYDDFEYAREALRLGVLEYISKPVMEDMFAAAMEKVLQYLDREVCKNRYWKWANEALRKNRSNLIADFFWNWIDGRLLPEEIGERMNFLHLDIPREYTLTEIVLEEIEERNPGDVWEDDLLYYAAYNIAGEILYELDRTCSCRVKSGSLVILSPLERAEVRQRKKMECQEMLERYLPVKAAIFQLNGEGYDALPHIYQELEEIIGERMKGTATIKQVKQLIEENYGKEDFSLVDVAERMHLSSQHLSRLFRKETGITFIDFLTRVRLRRAIDLLYHEDIRLYEIAEMVGYSTQHYFSNVFKKNMGISPAEYRKTIKMR